MRWHHETLAREVQRGREIAYHKSALEKVGQMERENAQACRWLIGVGAGTSLSLTMVLVAPWLAPLYVVTLAVNAAAMFFWLILAKVNR